MHLSFKLISRKFTAHLMIELHSKKFIFKTICNSRPLTPAEEGMVSGLGQVQANNNPGLLILEKRRSQAAHRRLCSSCQPGRLLLRLHRCVDFTKPQALHVECLLTACLMLVLWYDFKVGYKLSMTYMKKSNKIYIKIRST